MFLFSPKYRAGGVAIALGLLLPSVWWFYCQEQDRKRFAHHEQTVRKNNRPIQFLTSEHAAELLAMAPPEEPQPMRRRWPLVALGSVALVGTGGALMPPTDLEPANLVPAATSSVTSVTTTSKATAKTGATTPTSTTSDRSEEARRSSEAKQREEEARRAEEERQRAEQARAEEERARAEQARFEEEARVRAEQEAAERAALEEANTQPQGLLAPAPAPARSAYYANCTAVWNDIGGPIYQGQPGYASHLDKDGDGVGCENRPR